MSAWHQRAPRHWWQGILLNRTGFHFWTALPTTTTTMNGRLLWTLLCLSALFTSYTHAAHSRRRPTTVRREPEPRYDRSITTFSPDGRLQQVEYSMEASRRGDPVIAMTCGNITCIAVHSSDKVHRIDDHLLLVTAGLVGDGRMLASTLRSHCQQFQQQTGEAPTVREAARIAADLQHMLTRTPGARPLGCTAIMAGHNHGGKSPLALFQTDPGGILEECHFCAVGKGQEKAMMALESLSKKLQSGSKKEDGALAVDRIQLIQGVAEVALETFRDKDSPPHVDVWILESDAKRRGGLHLQCIQKITRNDLSLLKEQLMS